MNPIEFISVKQKLKILIFALTLVFGIYLYSSIKSLIHLNVLFVNNAQRLELKSYLEEYTSLLIQLENNQHKFLLTRDYQTIDDQEATILRMMDVIDAIENRLTTEVHTTMLSQLKSLKSEYLDMIDQLVNTTAQTGFLDQGKVIQDINKHYQDISRTFIERNMTDHLTELGLMHHYQQDFVRTANRDSIKQVYDQLWKLKNLVQPQLPDNDAQMIYDRLVEYGDQFSGLVDLQNKTHHLFEQLNRLLEYSEEKFIDLKSSVSSMINNDQESIIQKVDTIKSNLVIWSLLIVLLILSLGIILSRHLNQVLDRLMKGIKEFTVGNLAHTIHITQQDEFGQLAAAMNQMATKLDTALKNTQKELHERKQIEMRLKNEKNRLHLIQQITPVGMITLNRDNMITSWNYKASEITGYSSMDTLNAPPPERLAPLFDMNTSHQKDFEVEILTKSQVSRVICRNTANIQDVTGQIVGTIITFEDITDRKEAERVMLTYNEQLEKDIQKRTQKLSEINNQLKHEIELHVAAEQALRKAEQEQHALLNNIPDMAWLKDNRSRYVSVNDSLVSATGVDRDDMIGKTDLDFFDKSLAEQYLRDDLDVIKTKKRKVIVEPFINKYGKRLWIQTIKTPILDEEFGVIGTAGISRDITEEEEIKSTLKRNEERYKKLFQASQEAFMLINKDGCITDLNSAALKLFEAADRSMLIGKHFFTPEFFKLNAPNDTIDEQFQIGLKHGQNTFDGKLCKCNQDIFFANLFMTRISLEDQTILQVTIRDISQQKEAESMLEAAKLEAIQASKLKSDFLSNVSHEIRTPLNTIISFTENLLSADKSNKKINAIFEEAKILLHLINALLDHSKIEAGKMELEYHPMDLTKVLKSMETGMKQKAERKGLHYESTIDTAIHPYIIGDSFRLRQILINLVNNAIKFTEFGSVKTSIKLIDNNTETQKQRLVFEVRDTGIGIPDDKIQSIFELFTQADGSITRRYGGTGLGTNIAKSLVELMGGTMSVSSVVGEGSCFSFELELQTCEYDDIEHETEDSAQESIPSITNRDTSRLKILIVEDYPPNQDVALMHLSSEGLTADIANDGLEAIDLCQKRRYDLILMDVQMPMMDGFEATRNIRELNNLNQQTPIIAMTAHAGVEARNSCLKAGMNDVLTKPLRRKAFVSMLSNYLKAETLAKDSSDHDEKIPENDMEPKNETDSSSKDPIDLDAALDEFGSNKKLFEQSLKLLIKRCRKQIETMVSALAEQDFAVIRQEAHKIKGAAASLMANPLARAAETIEDHVDDEQFDRLEGALNKFKEEFDAIEQYLDNKLT
jgi:PAS domain S-box-containing protein